MLLGGVVRGRRNPRHFLLPTRLQKARLANGLTRTKLSQLAGLTNKAVSDIEDKRILPRITTIARLAQVLGVSPGWLTFGIGDLPPSEVCAETLGQRLRESRSARGLSRATLGRSAQVSVGAIQHLEDERGVANAETIERLAVALDVSPAWLAFGEGSVVPSSAGHTSGDPRGSAVSS